MRWQGVAIRGALASLLAGLAGCAGKGSQNISTAAIPAATDLPSERSLTGMWKGDFYQTGMGDAGVVSGDITCQISDDGTYKLSWMTRLVAGSSRAGRMDSSGTVVPNGKSVVFNDSSGSQFSLQRSGNTLYGIRRDPAGGRANVQVRLERVTEAP